MIRVGCYIRVSTQEQADEGYSIGAQTERLAAYCKARDWFVYETYIDPGYSGSNTERPALKKLILDVKNNKLDIVLVYKLDRLSRSQKDTLLLIEDVFNKNNVDFVSINENFDTSTAFGRAMVGILSVFAQLEREQIKERTSMGRLERAKDGYFHGGGYDPIGYDYIDGALVINEYEALQVRKVFELFVEKQWPITRIRSYMEANYTNRFGSWHSHSSVVSTITQGIVTGKIHYAGEVYDGRHPAIIDEETFKRAQARYELIRWNKKDDKHKKRPFQAKHLLTGLLVCGNCGARYFAKGNYSGHGDKKVYRPYYTCYSRAKTVKRMIIDPDCRNKSYYHGELDRIVIDEVLKLSFDPAYFEMVAAQSSTEVVNLRPDGLIFEDRVRDLDKQIGRLLDLYQLGSVDKDALVERVQALTSEKQLIVDQMIALDEQAEESRAKLDPLDAIDLLRSAKAILSGDDLNKKRELVHSLIDRIDLIDNDIVINWAFV